MRMMIICQFRNNTILRISSLIWIILWSKGSLQTASLEKLLRIKILVRVEKRRQTSVKWLNSFRLHILILSRFEYRIRAVRKTKPIIFKIHLASGGITKIDQNIRTLHNKCCFSIGAVWYFDCFQISSLIHTQMADGGGQAGIQRIYNNRNSHFLGFSRASWTLIALLRSLFFMSAVWRLSVGRVGELACSVEQRLMMEEVNEQSSRRWNGRRMGEAAMRCRPAGCRR